MNLHIMEKQQSTKHAVSPAQFTWMWRWPQWVRYVATIWSLLFGLLGVYWLIDSTSFPLGVNDSRASNMGSLFINLPADSGAMIVAILGFVGVFVSLVGFWKIGKWSLPFVLYAWIMCVTLLWIVPDARIAQNFAYLFLFHFDLIDGAVLLQFYCILGGLIWGATALSMQRRFREACVACGRSLRAATTDSKRWGKWVTYFSALMVLPYGISRISWGFGFPLAVHDEQMAETIIHATLDERLIEFVLGGLHIGGGILILGLIQRWGEIFPRWLPFLSGKRVPVWFAVISATLASIIFMTLGSKVFLQILGGITAENWGMIGPGLFWLPLGLSLSLVTYDYYLRRRGQCKRCGRL